MRTGDRLDALEKFLFKHLCAGRTMKTPAQDYDIAGMTMQEPRCFTCYYPSMPDLTGRIEQEGLTVCPSILILPNISSAKQMEEKRFDRYNNVHRPKELGQTLTVQLLFCIYEPGTRLPGFLKSAESEEGLDMRLFEEGTRQGARTLFNWMDDGMELLLGQQQIPGTDLFLLEEQFTYAPYTDQNYIVDRRPLYYGVMNVTFGCYADAGRNPAVEAFLK